MSNYKWNLDKTDGQRPNHSKDLRFKRKIARFGPFHLWESIRIIQKDEYSNAMFRYHRAVGMYDGYMHDNLFSKLIKPYYKDNEIGKVLIEKNLFLNHKFFEYFLLLKSYFFDGSLISIFPNFFSVSNRLVLTISKFDTSTI